MTGFVARVLQRSRRLWRDRGGAAAIEFGLCGTGLIMFMVGGMEFGRYMWIKQSMEFGLEEAARLAIAKPSSTTAELIAKAKDKTVAVPAANLTVVSSQATIGAVTYIVITASYPFDTVSGLVPLGSRTISHTTRVPSLP
jgi:Flp pilus assembly protein TadG